MLKVLWTVHSMASIQELILASRLYIAPEQKKLAIIKSKVEQQTFAVHYFPEYSPAQQKYIATKGECYSHVGRLRF